MRSPVLNKTDMYERLAAGLFGNTIPMFFDPAVWAGSEDAAKYEWWGVRTLTPAGPCALNCRREDVLPTAERFMRGGHKVNISMMVDKVATVTAWLEVLDTTTGMVVEGIEYPKTPEWTWRNSMPVPSRRRKWEGTLARHVLRRHLNANSYEDLMENAENYPDHVIELSALDRCLGTVPHRNGINWETRRY